MDTIDIAIIVLILIMIVEIPRRLFEFLIPKTSNHLYIQIYRDYTLMKVISKNAEYKFSHENENVFNNHRILIDNFTSTSAFFKKCFKKIKKDYNLIGLNCVVQLKVEFDSPCTELEYLILYDHICKAGCFDVFFANPSTPLPDDVLLLFKNGIPLNDKKIKSFRHNYSNTA